MIKLPAGLQRAAAYAAIAALVTGVLFAVDGAYRWYDASRTHMPAPFAAGRTAETPDPAPAEAVATATPAQGPEAPLHAETKTVEPPSEVRPITAQTPNPAGDPAPASQSVSNRTVTAVPNGSSPNAAVGIAPDATAQSAQAAPQIAQPPLPPSRPELRTQPAREAMPERAAPRRPVQAAEQPVRSQKRAQKKPAEQPNVYWERDDGSQLGFAPQLRKRTCDPATGQMPMQCYYPREGRERFPAKPLN
ncbi:MAG: hypothetical protein ACOY5F_20180 [Pseudomonadota bacterium]